MENIGKVHRKVVDMCYHDNITSMMIRAVKVRPEYTFPGFGMQALLQSDADFWGKFWFDSCGVTIDAHSLRVPALPPNAEIVVVHPIANTMRRTVCWWCSENLPHKVLLADSSILARSFDVPDRPIAYVVQSDSELLQANGTNRTQTTPVLVRLLLSVAVWQRRKNKVLDVNGGTICSERVVLDGMEHAVIVDSPGGYMTAVRFLPVTSRFHAGYRWVRSH